MSMPVLDQVTALLDRWRAGDRQAEAQLMSQLYPVVRSLVQREVGGVGGKSTLQATELAHEVYLRLLEQELPLQDRAHLMAAVGRTIRCVVVDLYRQRHAQKRGGLIDFITFDWQDENNQPAVQDSTDLLAIDEALTALAQHDPGAAQVVELRYFSELKNHEIAKVTGVSVATVVRQLRFGRAWLNSHL